MLSFSVTTIAAASDAKKYNKDDETHVFLEKEVFLVPVSFPVAPIVIVFVVVVFLRLVVVVVPYSRFPNVRSVLKLGKTLN